MDNPLTDLMNSEPLSVYTRAHAVADGMIKPLPQEVSRPLGFRIPVDMTLKLHSALSAWPGLSPTDPQALIDLAASRVLTVLETAHAAIRSSLRNPDRLDFTCALPTNNRAYYGPDDARLRLVVHPGDDGSPIVLIGYADDEW